MCPDPSSPDPVPVVIGTNTKKPRSLNQCEEPEGNNEVHSLRICTAPSEQPPSPGNLPMDAVCQVKWQGPANLPAGVLVPPVVLPPSAMDTSGFTLTLKNESGKKLPSHLAQY